MIRRLRDMERVGAEAAAADGPAAEIEAREDMTDARRSRPRGKARAAAAVEAAEAVEVTDTGPNNGAAGVASVADRFVRELVLKYFTNHEHERCAGSAVSQRSHRGWRRRMEAAAAEGRRRARNLRKVRPPRMLPRPLLPIVSAMKIISEPLDSGGRFGPP